MRRAQAGDAASFEQLYRAHAGRVFALCLRMAGERERARELAHDSFVQAWEKLGSFRGEAAFSTWLHRLAVNVVLERQRGERRRRLREVCSTDLAADGAGFEGGQYSSSDAVSIDDSTGTEGGIARSPRRDDAMRLDLEAAIARLPTNARLVFVLHAVEGYRHEEIAGMMAIAEGTVRAHLHRARQLLMEFLSR